MNEKSPPATPGRPTPSPEKVAQRVMLWFFILYNRGESVF
jgi:hypothetical protein